MPDGSLLDQIFASGGNEDAGFLKTLTDQSLEKGLLIHSEIPTPATLDFALLLTFADRMNSKVLKGYAKRYLQTQVIKDRKRAGELVELYQTTRSHRPDGEVED